MSLDISSMHQQAVLLRDAEEVLTVLQDATRRTEFLQEFSRAGWDVAGMRDAIRIACNNIAQADPAPAISFDPYTI